MSTSLKHDGVNSLKSNIKVFHVTFLRVQISETQVKKCILQKVVGSNPVCMKMHFRMPFWKFIQNEGGVLYFVNWLTRDLDFISSSGVVKFLEFFFIWIFFHHCKIKWMLSSYDSSAVRLLAGLTDDNIYLILSKKNCRRLQVNSRMYYKIKNIYTVEVRKYD